MMIVNFTTISVLLQNHLLLFPLKTNFKTDLTYKTIIIF